MNVTTTSGHEMVIPVNFLSGGAAPESDEYKSLPTSVLTMKIKTNALDVTDAPPRASVSMRTPDGPALVGECHAS